MDSRLIEKAKKVAEEREVSLSSLVADYFDVLSNPEDSVRDFDLEELPPKTRSLYGVASSLGDLDEKRVYREYLREKHT